MHLSAKILLKVPNVSGFALLQHAMTSTILNACLLHPRARPSVQTEVRIKAARLTGPEFENEMQLLPFSLLISAEDLFLRWQS